MDFDKELFEQVKPATPAISQPETIPAPEGITSKPEDKEGEQPEPIKVEEPIGEAPAAEVTIPDEVPAEKAWYEEEEVTETPNEYLARLKGEFDLDETAPEKVYQKLKEFADRKPEADPILEDPLVREVIAIRKNGGDIQQFITQIGGDDPSKKSLEELNRIRLEKFGLEGEELQAAQERFIDMPKEEQIEKTNAVKAQLIKERNEKLDQFKSTREAQAQQAKARMEKAVAELDTVVGGYADKEVWGWKITPDVAAKHKQRLMTDFPVIHKADGSVDVERMFKLSLLEKHVKDIVKTNASKGKNEGVGQILKDMQKPSANTMPLTPATSTKESDAEIANRLLDKEMEKQGIK